MEAHYILDIAILCILFISALLAFARGFLREVFSLSAWVGAAIVALIGYPFLSPTVNSFLGNDRIADLASAALIFLTSLLIFSLLAIAMSSIVKGTRLNPLDRSLGFIFGLLRGAVLVCLLYLMVSVVIRPDQQPEWIQKAQSKPFLAYGAKVIYKTIPQRFWDSLGSFSDNIEKMIQLDEQSKQMLRDQLMAPPTIQPKSVKERDGYSEKERIELDSTIKRLELESEPESKNTDMTTEQDTENNNQDSAE